MKEEKNQETSTIKKEEKKTIDTKEALQLILKDKLSIERAISILVSNFEKKHNCLINEIESIHEMNQETTDNVVVRYKLKIENPFQ